MGLTIAKCPDCPTYFKVETFLEKDACPECGMDWEDAEIAPGGGD